MISGMASFVAYADEITTFLDFEGISELPAAFARRGGSAEVASLDLPHGKSNAVRLYANAEYNISDSNQWMNFDDIYFESDVMVGSGATFICLSARRFSNYIPYVTFSGGNVVVGSQNAASYSSNTWYKLIAVLHSSASTIDCWLNGVKIAEGVAVNTTNKDANTFIAFKTTGGRSNMDNIKLSNVIPEIKETVFFNIISSLPENGATDVDASDAFDLSVTFECGLDTATIENCVLVDNGATIEGLSYDADSKTLSFSVASLKWATEYSVSFADSLMGENGEKFNSVNSDNVIKFSTGYQTFCDTYDGDVSFDPEDETNRVKALLSATVASSDGKQIRVFPSTAIESSAFSVSFDLYIPEEPEYSSISFYPMATNGKGNGQVCLNIRPDGSAKISESDEANLKDSIGRNILIKKGMWHTFDYSVKNKSASMWINGYKIVNSKSTNLENFGSMIFNFVSSEDAKIYIDNLTISNNPSYIPDGSFRFASADLDEKGTVRVTFSKRVDLESVIGDNIIITDYEGNVQSGYEISLSKDQKTFEIKTDSLIPDSTYNLSCNGILSEYGTELESGFDFEFKTPEAVKVGEVVYTNEASKVIASLCTGKITASAGIFNGTSKAVEVTFVTALCKGDVDCYTIEAFETDYVGNLSPKESISFKKTIEVPEAEGYFLKTFVWGNTDKSNPYIIAKAFI